MEQDIITSTEDWNAYRKLVVETIRRLDERTLELHDLQNKIISRVQTIEDQKLDLACKDIRLNIKDLEGNFKDYKNELTTKFSVESNNIKWVVGIGGAAWSVIIIIAGIAAKVLIK